MILMTLINWGHNNGIKDFFLEKPRFFPSSMKGE